MKIPAGYSETEVLAIIKQVSSVLAPRYAFSYYTAEDVEQEAFVICLKVLEDESYDSTKGNLDSFLFVHLNKRLHNLRRDKFYRKPKTCNVCTDRTCAKCQGVTGRLESKRSLMNVADASEYDMSDDNQAEINLARFENLELYTFLRDNLPLELRSDFLKMAHGRSIPKHRREKVENAVVELRSEYR